MYFLYRTDWTKANNSISYRSESIASSCRKCWLNCGLSSVLVELTISCISEQDTIILCKVNNWLTTYVAPWEFLKRHWKMLAACVPSAATILPASLMCPLNLHVYVESSSITSNAYQCSTPSEVWFLPFLMQVAFSGSFVGSPYKSPSLRKWTQYTQCRAFYIQVCWLGYYLIELVKQGTLVSLWFFSEPNPFGANTLFQGHLQIMLIHIFTLLSTVIRFSFPSITTWYDRLKHVIWLIKTNQK